MHKDHGTYCTKQKPTGLRKPDPPPRPPEKKGYLPTPLEMLWITGVITGPEFLKMEEEAKEESDEQRTAEHNASG